MSNLNDPNEPLHLAHGSGTPIYSGPVGEDFVTTATGRQVYDKGETIVSKMNNQHAEFDKDLFFQDLFENYLCCVERHEPRINPKSKIITYWDMHTSFDDFLSDSVDHIDQQIQDIKFTKAAGGAQKVHALDDSFLAEAKIDSGSAAIGQKFGMEDFDAVYELLCRSKEIIYDYKAGRINIITDTRTGRVRVTNNIA